jgi:hypothetical protein
MMSASITAQKRRLTTNASTAHYLHASARFAQAKVLPPREGYGLAAETDFDARSFLAAPDHRERTGVRGCSEQLVVLSEGQILVRGAGRERNLFELDQDPTAGARGEMTRIRP